MYKPSPENKEAVALLCMNEATEFQVSALFPIWEEGLQLKEEVSNNPLLLKNIEGGKMDARKRPGFSLQQEVRYYEGRLVIHATPFGGHFGFYRTYQRYRLLTYIWLE